MPEKEPILPEQQGQLPEDNESESKESNTLESSPESEFLESKEIKWDYSSLEAFVVQAKKAIDKYRQPMGWISGEDIADFDFSSNDLTKRYGLGKGGLTTFYDYIYLGLLKDKFSLDEERITELLLKDFEKTIPQNDLSTLVDGAFRVYRYAGDRPNRSQVPTLSAIEKLKNGNRPQVLARLFHSFCTPELPKDEETGREGDAENDYLEANEELVREILQDKTALEVGGNLLDYYLGRYGLKVQMPPDIPSDYDERIPEAGRVTLDSYRDLIGEEQVDVGYTRELMSWGSGIEYGKHSYEYCVRELMTVFANKLKRGGIMIHIGDMVVTDEEFLKRIGVKLQGEFRFDFERGTPQGIYFFTKEEEMIVSKKDFERIVSVG